MSTDQLASYLGKKQNFRYYFKKEKILQELEALGVPLAERTDDAILEAIKKKFVLLFKRDDKLFNANPDFFKNVINSGGDQDTYDTYQELVQAINADANFWECSIFNFIYLN